MLLKFFVVVFDGAVGGVVGGIADDVVVIVVGIVLVAIDVDVCVVVGSVCGGGSVGDGVCLLLSSAGLLVLLFVVRFVVAVCGHGVVVVGDADVVGLVAGVVGAGLVLGVFVIVVEVDFVNVVFCSCGSRCC